MRITYFFRKQSPVFHSIEEQYFAVQKELPEELVVKNHFANYHSKGILRRLFIALQAAIQAAFRQGDVNHITGDIHFIALFLKKRKTVLTVHDIGSVVGSLKLDAGSGEPEVGSEELEAGSRKHEAGSWKPGLKLRVLRFFWFTMPFKRVKYVTVISEFTKKEVLQNFNIKEEKIVVIPDCVSPDIQFSEKEFNKKRPKILQIGTKENKNLKNLIPALEGIPCELTVVGKLCCEQIALLNKHKIKFKNVFNLDYKEIISLYKETDLVIFVSTYEGFGVPILEAQASGRPLITSNISPMNEVAGEGAVLVDPNDVEAIKKGILSVMNNDGLRQNIIEKGRENVKGYSAKAVAEMYVGMYRKLG